VNNVGSTRVYLIGDRGLIFDYDDAFKIFSSGFFGKPIGISKPKLEPFNRPLELSLFEILYLSEKGIVEVLDSNDKVLTKEAIIKHARCVYRDFDNKFLVYKDLRDKGFVVRPGLKFGADFAVYRYGPGIDHAPFLVTVYSSDVKLLGIDLVRAGRLATSVRKRFVIATVKGEKVIRYFVLEWFRP